MKLIYLVLVFTILTKVSVAQNQVDTPNFDQKIEEDKNVIYKLFPTQNIWTFIKLDTRNGKMWQVHFTVEEDGNEGEVVLNSLPLVDADKETNGRFTLYATENIYNFILLDQIDGHVFQVQWSMEEKYRGVSIIF